MYGFKSRCPLSLPFFVYFSMGALTSKPYAFMSRPWELIEREAFDLFDTVGSAVKLSIRGKEVMRVLPNPRFSSSEEWIADVSRFSYDSILASSRLKTLTFYSEFFGILSVADYSKIWFTEFLAIRLSSFYTHGHFCLTYLKTLFFFTDVLGRFSYVDPISDFRHFPYRQLQQFQSVLATKTISQIFLFDFNIRYTLPSFAVKLRQLLSQHSNFNLFNLGPTYSNLLSDTNLPYNQSSIVNLFRFKNRLSRTIFSTSAYALFSFKSYRLYGAFLELASSSFSVFFSTPSEVSISELGGGLLAASCNRSLSRVQIGGGLVSYLPTSIYFGANEVVSSIFIPLPHPYEDEYTYFQGGRSHTFSSPLVFAIGGGSFVPSFPFYFKAIFPKSYTPSALFCDSIIFTKVLGRVKISSSSFNYFSHFFSNHFLENSVNILLNVKRHNEFRSSYIYYL